MAIAQIIDFWVLKISLVKKCDLKKKKKDRVHLNLNLEINSCEMLPQIPKIWDKINNYIFSPIIPVKSSWCYYSVLCD